MSKKKYNLTDLVVTSVSLVNEGGNQRANVCITKNAPEAEQEATDKVCKALVEALLNIAKSRNTAPTKEQKISVAKDAKSFTAAVEGIVERENKWKVYDEICTITDGIYCSFRSILEDDEVTEKSALMKQSVDEFSLMAKNCIDKWCNGEPAGIKKSAPLDDYIKKHKPAVAKPFADDVAKKAEDNSVIDNKEPVTADSEPIGKNKEEKSMIDKSLLTPEELVIFETLEKKATAASNSVVVDDNVAKSAPADEPMAKETEKDVVKSAPVGNAESTASADNIDDVIKSISPAIAQVLASVDVKKKAKENEHFIAVAKKYEILGIKANEMAEVLKSVVGNKAQYEAVIKRFDDAVTAIEGSGMFAEIGKSGSAPADPWSAIEKHADKLMSADISLTRENAILKACDMHPDLVAKYEASR